MKKVIIGFMALLLVTGVFANGNMVVNGDFKQGKINWFIPEKDITMFKFLPENIMNGPYLQVLGAQKSDNYVRISNEIENVALSVGDEVILKVKLKCDKLTGKFELLLRQVDEQKKSLNYSGFRFSKSAAFDWKFYSKKIKIKAGAVSFFIYIISTDLGDDDAVYVKEISLKSVEK